MSPPPPPKDDLRRRAQVLPMLRVVQVHARVLQGELPALGFQCPLPPVEVSLGGEAVRRLP